MRWPWLSLGEVCPMPDGWAKGSQSLHNWVRKQCLGDTGTRPHSGSLGLAQAGSRRFNPSLASSHKPQSCHLLGTTAYRAASPPQKPRGNLKGPGSCPQPQQIKITWEGTGRLGAALRVPSAGCAGESPALLGTAAGNQVMETGDMGGI